MATKEQIKKELIGFGLDKKEVDEMKYQDLRKALKEFQESQPQEESKSEVKKVEKPKRVVQRDDIVSIMNTQTNKVIYNSKKTGAEWVWNEYGDVEEMEVSELATMKNAHPRFLREPWLLILDEDVVQYLGLSDLYKNVLNPDELDDFFKLPLDRMEQVLEKSPRGIKHLIIGVARQKIQNKTFDSMSKIKLIEETFGIELN